MKKLFLLGTFSLIFIFSSAFTVVAHRGETGGTNLPEHTFASYDRALHDGAAYIEQDLELSADGVLVVSHDATTSRMTGVDDVISQTSWTNLQTLKVANGEHLHTLAEVFARYAPQHVKFMLETRPVNHQLKMETILTQLIKQYGLQNRVIIESFSQPSLAAIKQQLPQVPTLWLTNSGALPPDLAALKAVDMIGNVWSSASAREVRVAHQAGKLLVPWQPLEKPGNVSAVMASRVDGIFTNYTRLYTHVAPVNAVAHVLQVKGSPRYGIDVWSSATAHRHFTGKRLPGGSRWHSRYSQVIAGHVWYNVGGNQWLNGSAVTIIK